jgi:hypothetical protein
LEIHVEGQDSVGGMNYKQLVTKAWKTTWKHRKFALVGLFLVIPSILGFNYQDIARFFPHVDVPIFLQSTFESEILARIIMNQWSHASADVSFWSLVFNGITYFLIIIVSAYCESVMLHTVKMIWQKEDPMFAIVLKRGLKSFPFILTLNLGVSLLRSANDLFSDYSIAYSLYNPIQTAEAAAGWLTAVWTILSLVSIVVLFLTLMGKLFVVIEDQRPLDGVIRAWNVFIQPHFWKTALVSLLADMGSLAIVGLFWVINLPNHAIRYFFRNPALFPGENTGLILYLLIVLLAIIVVSIEYGFKLLISNSVWFGFYDQIKAIDRAKEAAVAFDGELEMDINGDNMLAPSDSLPSGE